MGRARKRPIFVQRGDPRDGLLKCVSSRGKAFILRPPKWGLKMNEIYPNGLVRFFQKMAIFGNFWQKSSRKTTPSCIVQCRNLAKLVNFCRKSARQKSHRLKNSLFIFNFSLEWIPQYSFNTFLFYFFSKKVNYNNILLIK